MRMYRVTVKRGLLDYKTRLYVKIWFFWWFLEGYTTRTKDVAFEQARIYEKEFKISIDQVKLNV